MAFGVSQNYQFGGLINLELVHDMYESGLEAESKVCGKVLLLDWLKYGLGCVCGIFPSVAIFEANDCVWKTVWSFGIVIMSLSRYSLRRVVG